MKTVSLVFRVQANMGLALQWWDLSTDSGLIKGAKNKRIYLLGQAITKCQPKLEILISMYYPITQEKSLGLFE